MGKDYPVGIWANSYDAFYWGRRRLTATTRPGCDVSQGRVPVLLGHQGYTGMQFLVEGIIKAGSTDADEVAKALLGLSIDAPIGKQTIREKDHQANRGQLYGKTVMDPKYPFPIMKPVEYVDPTKFMD